MGGNVMGESVMGESVMESSISPALLLCSAVIALLLTRLFTPKMR